MLCPTCKVALSMSTREGIEIDYCPQCRGVWLDRGELDKIIERSISGTSARPQEHRPQQDYRPHQEYRPQEYKHKKKRGSFLEDLFDFD